MQKTKMIFTIGPASDNEETLKKFIEIGMSAARLNFSHGTHETHREKIELIQKLSHEMNTATAIVLDIKGPKIRTHNFVNGGVTLTEGDDFAFICGEEILGDEKRCSISYEELCKDIQVGGKILVDDGLLKFKVTGVEGTAINTKVIVGGEIKNHKGVNVPNVVIKLPSITSKDIEDIKFGCEMGVDFIAASFIRKASDVLDVKKVLKENHGEHIKVIAKIENQEGVDNIDSIIEVTDGVMVARGDMGVEIPIQKVPIIQKMIIKKCNEAGKIVITATQMLDSMIRNSIPTRAEASDICNAIFDGTDAIMLSGESASGLFPIEAAKTMAKIAQEAEEYLDYNHLTTRLREPSLTDYAAAISYSACRTANLLNAKAIVAATKSGATARLLSRYKSKAPIIAITPYEQVRRTLNLCFGIFPMQCDMFNTTDQILNEAKNVVFRLGITQPGDDIIVAAGMPTTQTGGTNMLKIEKL
ncbi:pyruvate kinase [Clostridium saccharobutylicum]|uniref:Pyruvate kinase n=1 Tax=Clostridium saccharobutylicum DSM 13864 TaxID=1345695 RepID=U5MLD5_CLOSA|nr:pyruvate kinase [Clostridium saccharobutylicum]AGX41619.1 pyruvate kinase PykF [Clostridium saccharobutylicum DSM 13864]AQR88901.1 pyruvate kinase [Clostridium saccharobutylicum]AQR98802.1 pyruvate kinase [Clostridium saccharobutylicum]AQS08531.1 pyruvate kinase [Clostridium saccharobutylicum]AQS12790.1 pyruvate kinase [Clostridium saccharobutylicum]